MLYPGFLQGKAQWVLWGRCLCTVKLSIFVSLLDCDVIRHLKYYLLHGEVSARIFKFSLRFLRPFKQHSNCGELHDDYSFTSPQLPNGIRYWISIYCKNSLLIHLFHPIIILPKLHPWFLFH